MAEHNPRRLTAEELVRALKAAGARYITVESLERDVISGAPTNADGTFDLLTYGAWLLKVGNNRGN